MANKAAVSKAQVTRMVTAAEAMGKTVTGLQLWPDGRVDVLFVGPAADSRRERSIEEIEEAGPDDWDEYDRLKAHRTQG